MGPADRRPPPETQRLDAFVDAAFAFAVTLFIIGGNTPPTGLADLQQALLRVPAFAAGFALVAVFWLGHRRFGQLAPVRDGLSVFLSLAIVFVILVLVYPMRLLTESGAHWLSGRVLPGGDLIATPQDLQAVYVVYGLGFAGLAALYTLLFHRVGRRPAAAGADADGAAQARTAARIWAVITLAGLLSAATAMIAPIARYPYAPGLAYWVIPIGVALLGFAGRLRAPAAELPPA
ncbi:MAG TPA: TMEM175 family protein [Brevundimonas sp.]|jgi:uncharacterized membrane protein|uniref:TMEM175 family protein n=1 Tax=Brevundimonas sp. TaxID=1871086 RepID=UPI002E138344|nr:TMEM175 family protein [Brevundimonas sp.]